jgi:hypothetical protein
MRVGWRGREKKEEVGLRFREVVFANVLTIILKVGFGDLVLNGRFKNRRHGFKIKSKIK